jgi:hypothetical protein
MLPVAAAALLGGAALWYSGRTPTGAEPGGAMPPPSPSAAASSPVARAADPDVAPSPAASSTTAAVAPAPPPPSGPRELPVESPAETGSALAGLETHDVSEAELRAMGAPEKMKGGVRVGFVDPRSSAAEAHLEEGDIIFRAHHTKVEKVADLERALDGRDYALIKVLRGGSVFQVVLHKPYKAATAAP